MTSFSTKAPKMKKGRHAHYQNQDNGKLRISTIDVIRRQSHKGGSSLLLTRARPHEAENHNPVLSHDVKPYIHNILYMHICTTSALPL